MASIAAGAVPVLSAGRAVAARSGDRWAAVLHGDRRVVLRYADQWVVALRLAPAAVPQYAVRAVRGLL